MKCENAIELISGYCEGSLDTASRVTFEAHLAACAKCRSAEQGVRAVWTSLDEMPVVEAPATLRADVWKRIEASPAKAPASKSSSRAPSLASLFTRRGLALAGAAVVVLALMAVTIPGNRIAAGWWPFGRTAVSGELRLLGAPAIVRDGGAARIQFQVQNESGLPYTLHLKVGSRGSFEETRIPFNSIGTTSIEPQTISAPIGAADQGIVSGRIEYKALDGQTKAIPFEVRVP
jgi:hypothetical protein